MEERDQQKGRAMEEKTQKEMLQRIHLTEGLIIFQYFDLLSFGNQNSISRDALQVLQNSSDI